MRTPNFMSSASRGEILRVYHAQKQSRPALGEGPDGTYNTGYRATPILVEAAVEEALVGVQAVAEALEVVAVLAEEEIDNFVLM